MTSPTAAAPRGILRAGAAMLVLFGAFGLVTRYAILLMGLARPGGSNIYFRLFALLEQPWLLLLCASGAALLVLARAAQGEDRGPIALPAPSGRAVALVAAAVFLVSLAATHLVMHGLLFSMDEFSVDFQARLFARGRYEAAVNEAWRGIAHAITPIFVSYRPATGSWSSVYLPVYAAFKAPFIALGGAGGGTLLNPLFAALGIVAIAGVARRLWPAEGERPWVAIALLATSSQFMATAATGYSMPAHLALDLVWVWLYLRGDLRSWYAALGVGVLALGLHNPFPHALFVAPFLIRLTLAQRWERVVPAAVVYGAGSVLWLSWFRLFPAAPGNAPPLLSLFAIPGWPILWVNLASVTLLFTWQSVLAIPLLVAAAWSWRRLPPVLFDLAAGIVLTLAFYLLFPSTQGHGWGHRYAHQILGSLALLAAAGVPAVRAAIGTVRTRQLLVGALALALVVQLPGRLVQVERFVRPFAAGQRYMASRPAEVVLFRGDSLWYGVDLLRNDPFMRTPVIVWDRVLTPQQRAQLVAAYAGRVVEVRDAELLRLGMTPWTSHLRR